MTTLVLLFDFLRCVAVALILSEAAILVPAQSQSQSGFVSIDCGYEGIAYNDGEANFRWDGDGTYILTGANAALGFAIDSTNDNSQALQTFRYFPETRSKHCYELPNVYNGSFLIRAMFLHGGSPLLPVPPVFNVSVGATNWFTVEYNSADTNQTLKAPKVFESVFYSEADVIHFCLTPMTGVPFISSLELRPLNITQTTRQFLWTVFRWNNGVKSGTKTVRFPDDENDRLWHPPDSADRLIPSYTNPSFDENEFNGFGKLLGDAWMNDTANSSITTKTYSIYYDGFANRVVNGGLWKLYLQEISPNSSSSTVRGMNIGLNDGYVSINVTQGLAWLPFTVVFGLNSYQKTLDFTFEAQPWSRLGPLVNAMEVYAQIDTDNFTTRTADVVALQSLQASFNLTDWQGDPCLPVAWNWVTCEYDSSTASASVNKILLSNFGIKGIIPSSIAQLNDLTEIQLDNNSLSGPIPDFLGNLHFLKVLSLNDNNLTGEIPENLLNKTGLNFTYSGNSLLEISSTSQNKKESNVGVIVGATVGALFIFLGVLTVMTWYLWSRKSKKLAPISDLHSTTEHHRLHAAGNIPLDLILEATNNYAQKIGTGSYGSVYYGVLRGKEVAVKVNNIHSDQRNLEFTNEVDILTRVHHKNLVSLIGFCEEGQQLILIYEYQANGTLREWLRDTHTYKDATSKEVTKFLHWPKRLQIAVNAAKGLEYLHKDCTPTIIHRDVKTSNILLGDNLVGKVADFGISKTALDETQELSTGFFTSVKGTNGYLDPEYFGTSILTQKSDVYSFGVVLAELISGQMPVTDLGNGNYSFLVDKLQGCIERVDLQSFADPRLKGNYDEECMWRVADIALSCIARNRDERPDMTEVARDLEMLQGRAWETNFSTREDSGLLDIPNKFR